MMFWYGDGMSGWGYALMIGGMVLFWVLIAITIIAVIRYAAPPHPPTPYPTAPSPERLLAERFARGEINEEEFRRRSDLLRDHRQTLPREE
jgi:putative membrane protein